MTAVSEEKLFQRSRGKQVLSINILPAYQHNHVCAKFYEFYSDILKPELEQPLNFETTFKPFYRMSIYFTIDVDFGFYVSMKKIFLGNYEDLLSYN